MSKNKKQARRNQDRAQKAASTRAALLEMLEPRILMSSTPPTVSVNFLATNNTAPILTGHVDDPSSVIIATVAGHDYATTDDGHGDWATKGPIDALADGVYDVTATATNNIGTTVDPTAGELTIDTVAPAVTITPLTTSDRSPALSGTVDDPAATIQVTVDGTNYAGVNNADGTWSLDAGTITPALARGPHDISVTATDEAGNKGTDLEAGGLVVDIAGPVVGFSPLTTNNPSPELTGTVDEPDVPVVVTVNGVSYENTLVINNDDGTWTLPAGEIPALADGTYDVSVTAVDGLGQSNPITVTGGLTIDTVAPVAGFTPVTADNGSPALTGTIDDPAAAVSVNVDGTDYVATNDGNGLWTVPAGTISPSLDNGSYDVAVTATDVAGNVSTLTVTGGLTIDTTATAAFGMDPQATNDPTPGLVGTVVDPLATITVTVGTDSETATNNGDGTWSLPEGVITPPLADGTYDVALTSTDSLGNTLTTIIPAALTIDTTAPVTTVNPLITNVVSPQLTGTINDPTAVVSVNIAGTDYDAVNNGDGTWTLPAGTISPDLTENIYDVTVTATDSLGNSSSTLAPAALVIDTTAPVAAFNPLSTDEGSPALTGTVDDPTATVVVTVAGTDYTAVNNDDGTWTLPADTISPDLADGSYNVTVTATDLAGNSSSTLATGALVVDTTAPVLGFDPVTTNIPSPELDGTVDDVSAVITVTVAGTDYPAANNGNGTWTLAAGTITPALADGSYDVTVTGVDPLGNTGSITVTDGLTIDTVAPVVGFSPVATNDPSPALTGTVDDPAAAVVVTVAGTGFAAVNNGDGTWTLAEGTITPALADGTYDVTVTATDAAGNVGTTTVTNGLTIDTVAPVAAFVAETADNGSPALVGTIDDPTATISVNVNGADYTATNDGNGLWTLPAGTISPTLDDGSYDVTVTATDPAGNISTVSVPGGLTVDTTITVPFGMDFQATNDSTPSLIGTVTDPAATIIVTIGASSATATNNGDGTWTLASGLISPALADGTYDVALTSTDSLGNTLTTVVPAALLIDTTAPVVTVNTLDTNVTSPQLTGTVDDPTATITVTVASSDYSAVNNGDGTWTLPAGTISPDLTDGVYDVTVTGVDPLGNTSSVTVTGALTIDTVAPVAAFTPVTTDNPSPALVGTIDDPTAAVSVNVNGADYAATNDGNGYWTVPSGVISTLDVGSYDVTVTATDGAGNVSVLTVTGGLTISTTVADIGLYTQITNIPSPELDGTIADTAATLTVTIGDQTFDAVNNADGTWTLPAGTITPALADGTYDVTLTSTDGGVSEAVTIEAGLIIDTTAPVVTFNPLTTNDPSPALTGTVDDPGAAISVNVDGADYAAVNNGDGTWTVAEGTITPLADGSYDVTVTATDAAGNVGTTTVTGGLTIDTVAPVVTFDPLTTNDPSPELTGTVDDPAAAISVNVDGADYAAVNNGDGTWTLAEGTITPLADGSYDVTVTATDLAGNVGTTTVTGGLTVNTSPTAPVVTFNPLVTNNPSPELTGTVDDPAATISVNVDGADYAAVNNGDGTWTLDEGTITPLADGSYDITVTATNSADEVGTTTVTGGLVIDTVAPVVTFNTLSTSDPSPALTGTVDDPTAAISVSVNGADYAAVNNGDGTWTLAEGTITPLAAGTYDVTVTATDAAGNVGTTTATGGLVVTAAVPVVTVNPQITNDPSPALTGTVSDATATITVTVDGDDYTAVNNGNGTWTLPEGTIDPLADGMYSVTVAATNSTGTGQTTLANALAVDTVAPIVTVAGTSALTSNGVVSGTVTDALPSSEIASVTVEINGQTLIATITGTTWTATLPTLAVGTYSLQVTATDNAGNASSVTVSSFTIASQLPEIAVSYDNNSNGPTPIYGTYMAWPPGKRTRRTHPYPVQYVAAYSYGTNLPDGTSTASAGLGTDFGNLVTGSAAVTRYFIVRNTGSAALTISDVTVPDGFTIVQALPASIDPGSYAVLGIELTTGANGTFSGDVSFVNNDADGGDGVESPYTFAISGQVAAPYVDLSAAVGADTDDWTLPPSTLPATSVTGIVPIEITNVGNTALGASQPIDIAIYARLTGTTTDTLLETIRTEGLKTYWSQFDNFRGWGEKYLTDASGQWYYVLSNGDLYKWTGSNSQSGNSLVDTLDTSFYQDPSLLCYQNLSGLGAGATAKIEAKVTLPDTLDNGTYNIVTVVDSTDVVTGDTNLANNTAVSSQTVTVAPAFVDLAVQVGNVSLPAHTTAGDGTPINVPMTLTNLGNQSVVAGQPVDIAIYARTVLSGANVDTLIKTIRTEGLATYWSQFDNFRGWGEKYLTDASGHWFYVLANGTLYSWTGANSPTGNAIVDTLDTSFYKDPSLLCYQSFNLPAGASMNLDTTVTLPAYLTSGNYNIVVVADSTGVVTADTNLANNTAESAASTTVTMGYYDLAAQIGAVSMPAQTISGDGTAISVPITVTNQGNLGLDDGACVNIAIYARLVGTTTDTLVKTIRTEGMATYWAQFDNFRGWGEKYFTTASGQWYYILSNGDLYSWSGFNSATANKLVDTLDTSFYQNPSSLCYQSLSGLASGASANYSTTVTLPAYLASGDYTLVTVVDCTNQMQELNKGNNTAEIAASTTVTMGYYDLDADVSSSGLPAQTTSGDGTAINVPITVTNEGNVALPAGESLDIAIYARLTGTTTDTLLKTIRTEGLATYWGQYDNFRGWGEKYFTTASGQWYYILSNGDLYSWSGFNSATANKLVENVGTSFYQNPSSLCYQSLGSLASGASTDYSTTVTLPAYLASGDYNLVVVVDSAHQLPELDRTDNTAVTAASMTVTMGYYDVTGELQTTSGSGTSWSLPLTATAGEALSGYTPVVISNDGNLALPVGQKVDVQVVAVDLTTPGNDVELGTLSGVSVSGLGAGDSTTVYPTYNLPTGLAADTYQVEAIITPLNNLVESDTANNTVLTDILGQTRLITVV